MTAAPDPFADDDPTERAIGDVMKERVRQIVAEHHFPSADDGLVTGELARMAAAHLLRAVASLFPADNPHRGINWHRAAVVWPFAARQIPEHERRRHLVIAAALVVAEIERIDRAAAREAAEPRE